MKTLKIIVLFFYATSIFAETNTESNACTSGSDTTVIYFVN
ncbi:hypothetical protein MNB_SUP05-SYMBIONT-5-391 [hydrothermal vent metagenome]|uniref:Uncharacterized protein n=1 Tax=hydrothermal vent metagenome TaxID=652676 RepID=A0A1W1E7F0_9ZZZZ